MENLINEYPNINDFSKLIKFSFNRIFKYFNQKISIFKSEYIFLIKVNKSLFIKNKDEKDTIFIDEIINVINNIKSNHKSAKIKIFTYKKYVKEIIKIKRDDENIDKKKIIDSLIKEIDDPPQSDIILSLSDLYSKIEKNLINGKNEKTKILKIFIINNESEKYTNINEKNYEIKELEKVLNEFINEKSCYFGVEFICLNNKILQIKDKNSKKKNISEIILKNDEFWKKAENINNDFYEKWKEIYSNEDISDGIKRLDELLKFFKNVLNSIFFIKNKIKNCRNEKKKGLLSQKMEDYVTSNNLNNIKDGIISSDINESFMDELSNYKKIINKIEMNNFISEEIQNKMENNSIYINNISKYLIKQKEYIFQFLEILEKSMPFINSIEKEIFKHTKDIFYNNDNEIEKSEEEENEEEEEIK